MESEEGPFYPEFEQCYWRIYPYRKGGIDPTDVGDKENNFSIKSGLG